MSLCARTFPANGAGGSPPVTTNQDSHHRNRRSWEGSATVIEVVIRHAERDNFFILTDKGHKRAKALIDAVGDMGITIVAQK